MNIIIENNGYLAEEIQCMRKTFDMALEKLFSGCTVKHFYYGDELDMASVVLSNGNYGYFNIKATSVHFNGHTCTHEEYDNFCKLTFNDDCYDGQLFEICGLIV